MTSPSTNWNLVPVTAKFMNADGTAVKGRVIFTPRASRLVDLAALTTVIGNAVIATLANGVMTISLPATDDPDVTPTDFTYLVKEDFPGGISYEISVPLASAGAGIDLASLVPADPSPGTTIGPIYDHGDTTGALAVGGGGHELDLTGNVVVTITGLADVTLFAHGTGETLTVAGTVFTIDGDATILVVASPRGTRSAYLAQPGGGIAAPDSTPPSAPTSLIASAITDDTVTLTASGATGGVDHYEYSINMGVSWQAPGDFAELLPATTYVAWAVAVDATGNVSTGHVEESFTTAVDPSNHVTDAFTGADGALAGHVTSTAGKTWANYTYTNSGTTPLLIAGNRATSGTTVSGGAATFVHAQQDVTVATDYDVSVGANASVRLVARGSNVASSGVELRVQYTSATAATLSVEGGGLSNFVLIDNLPLTGHIGIKVVGNQFTMFANGKQIGKPFTSTAVGTQFGMALRYGAFADNFYCSSTHEAFTDLSLTVEDLFTADDAASISGRSTPTGARTWLTSYASAGLAFALGITGNAVTQQGANTGGSAGIFGPIFNSPDVTVSANYDVTTASAQVRLMARGVSSGANTFAFLAGVRNNGSVYYKTTYAGAETDLAASGHPTTGKLSIELVGTVAKVYINDVQVGSNVTVTNNASTPYVGVGTATSGKALDFKAVWL